MGEDHAIPNSIGVRVRAALESADVLAMSDLLDPNVTWGAPDDPKPSCTNRTQVLAWYQRGRDAGVRARVTEFEIHGDRILVGLRVAGTLAADEQGGEADRWQVVTLREDRIVDIRAFDDRDEAAFRAIARA
jgi:ketosteroid isomerase-like protein